jgi:hypothetical protein
VGSGAEAVAAVDVEVEVVDGVAVVVDVVVVVEVVVFPVVRESLYEAVHFFPLGQAIRHPMSARDHPSQGRDLPSKIPGKFEINCLDFRLSLCLGWKPLSRTSHPLRYGIVERYCQWRDSVSKRPWMNALVRNPGTALVSPEASTWVSSFHPAALDQERR